MSAAALATALNEDLTVQIHDAMGIHREAHFSSCLGWRYLLKIVWNEEEPLINFAMLNPSTADAFKNDPTVAGCQKRATAWGYGGLLVTNAYAFRSTDPKGLWTTAGHNPVGYFNNEFIERAARESEIVVCGWGEHIKPERHKRMLEVIRAAGRVPHALVLNKSGYPKHPLYVKHDIKPFEMPT